MKTITLKVDDNFFEELNRLVKECRTTKTEFIKEAIREYKNKMEKEKLRKIMHNASLKVRKDIKKVTNDFDSCVGDGL